MDRYRALGRGYDVVSLEVLLYRRPRRRMLSLLDLPPGATVLDLGCGTGLNFAAIHAAIGPRGRLLGVDSSASMLGAARRRVERAGWENVDLLEADVRDLPRVLPTRYRDRPFSAVVATYVLALLDADDAIWAEIDARAREHPVRVGIVDLGPARGPAPRRRLLDAFASLGGARLDRRRWERLTDRAADAVTEMHLGGHAVVSVGTVGRW